MNPPKNGSSTQSRPSDLPPATTDLTSGSQVPICLPREDDRLGRPRQVWLTVYAQPLLHGSPAINNTTCTFGRPGIEPVPSEQQAGVLTTELTAATATDLLRMLMNKNKVVLGVS